MERSGAGGVLRSLTVAVLFLVILLLVVFSARAYQYAVDVQDKNDELRAVLSYVVTAVNADRASRVSVEERDGMRVLVIRDVEADTEQRIFFDEGAVREDYGLAGSLIDRKGASEIGSAKRFEIIMIKEDLIRIDTDLGSSYVHIH